MKKLMNVLPLLLVVVLLFGTACQSNKKKDAESVNVTLFDKDLPEIKTLVNGEWELVSGKNAREFCEYENTFIKFADDQYVWTEDGKAEPGALNWRKADTGAGYEAYLMDVFYETNPAYLVAVSPVRMTLLVKRYTRALCKPFHEITEERYYELLECLPPARMQSDWFLVGEPYYRTLYALCFESDGRYFRAERPIRLSNAEIYRRFREHMEKVNLHPAIVKKASSSETLTNPSKIVAVSNAAMSALTVDEKTNPYTLLTVALAFKSATGSNGISGSVYWSDPDYYVDGVGSSVLLDDAKNTELFNQLADGTYKAGTVGNLAEG